MKPPASDWAAWAYRAGMAVISSFAMIMLAIITWRAMDAANWPAAALPKLLEILGWTVLGLLALLVVQQLGLVARNLVRNWNLKAGRDGVEMNLQAHDQDAGQ